MYTTTRPASVLKSCIMLKCCFYVLFMHWGNNTLSFYPGSFQFVNELSHQTTDTVYKLVGILKLSPRWRFKSMRICGKIYSIVMRGQKTGLQHLSVPMKMENFFNIFNHETWKTECFSLEYHPNLCCHYKSNNYLNYITNSVLVKYWVGKLYSGTGKATQKMIIFKNSLWFLFLLTTHLI